jgi:hypothetical protein
MLLKGNKFVVTKSVNQFKKGAELTIEEIAALDLQRNGQDVGAVVKFEELNDRFPISIFESEHIKEKSKLTTKQIENWFR